MAARRKMLTSERVYGEEAKYLVMRAMRSSQLISSFITGCLGHYRKNDRM